MKRWIEGKKLIARWGIMPFELPGYMKKSLQAYTKPGKKVCDLDSLRPSLSPQQKRLLSLISDLEELQRLGSKVERLSPGPPLDITQVRIRQLREEINELKQQGTKMPCPTPWPEDYNKYHWVSFSIPSSEMEASEAITEFEGFVFIIDDVFKFEKKHDLIESQVRSDHAFTEEKKSKVEAKNSEKFIKRRLRYHKKREEIRKEAERQWAENPDLKKTEFARSSQVQKIQEKYDRDFKENTIKNWADPVYKQYKTKQKVSK